MLKRQIRNRQLMMWVGDAVAILVAVQIAISLTAGQMVFLAHGFKSIAIGACFFLTLLFYITDLYNPRRDQRSQETASLIVLDVAIAMAFVTLAFYFYPHWGISRSFFLVVFLSTPGLVVAERLLWARLYGALARPSVVGVLGEGPAVEELRQVASEHDLKVVSLNSLEPEAGDSADHGATALQSALARLRPDIVVLSPSAALDSAAARLLIDARFSGITVLDLPTLFQLLSGKLPLEHLDAEWLLRAHGFQFFESNMAVKAKRLSDLALAAVFLVLSSPLWPLIAIGIKISSRGPAFYTQERVGQNEQVFRLIKFRTMAANSEASGPVWAAQNDGRIFYFGRLLRLFRLDELPQLINILNGSMSFVGPRPERPVFVTELKSSIPYYSLRSSVRPGLTGWAQVNYSYGASTTDALEKLKYDLHYIQNLSLLFDLQIVLRTFRTVLGRQGSR
ncbi:MAG TPA: sugar transferase [Terriglobia bacterium]|nr:sugar transferase [Terriglobia bacterium]